MRLLLLAAIVAGCVGCSNTRPLLPPSPEVRAEIERSVRERDIDERVKALEEQVMAQGFAIGKIALRQTEHRAEYLGMACKCGKPEELPAPKPVPHIPNSVKVKPSCAGEK
jgi:hypothetical protein